MHVYVPPHFIPTFWESLNIFQEQQIGQGGPTATPAHFPYLKPLDFYIWGHLNSTKHTTLILSNTTQVYLK
jgi:hypothetical protein